MLVLAFIIASFFPPYDQYVLGLQLAPDAVAGDCVGITSDPVGPDPHNPFILRVHGNTPCIESGGMPSFSRVTLGTAGTDGVSDILLGSSACAGYAVINTDSTAQASGITDPAITLGCGSPQVVIDSLGDLGVPGFLGLNALTINGNLNGIAVPTTGYDGTALASSFHCLDSHAAGVTGTGTSTAIAWALGDALFASNVYTISITDTTAHGFVTITAQTATGFTFTSINGHIYSFQACGE